MPSALASRGEWTVTGRPSKRYSPESIEWVPLTHLTSVDFPAPLSPTSAVTFPAPAWKSTPLRTSTGPKLFLMSRSSRIGWSLMSRHAPSAGIRPMMGTRDETGTSGWGGGWGWPPRCDGRRPPPVLVWRWALLLHARVGALRDVRALAHAGLRRVLVVDRKRHGGLGDGGRGGEDRGDLLLRLRVRDRHTLGVRDLAVRQLRDGLHGRVRLELRVLVDREALVAVHDVLQALGRRVLAGDGHLAVEALPLQVRDHGAGHRVVRDHDRLEVRGLAEHRAELATRGGGVPVAVLLGHLGPARRVLQHAVVALVEQRGVVVGGRTVDLDVLDLLLALHLRALGQRLPLDLADLHVVEGDVERSAAAGGEPVVVDRDDAVLGGLLLDLRSRGRIEVDDHQDLDLVGLHLPGDGLHLARGAAGVLDVAVQVVLRAVRLERRRVGSDPARRGRGVGQDDPHLRALAVDGPARGRAGLALGGGGRGRRGRRGGALVVARGAAGGEGHRRGDPEHCERHTGLAHTL